MVSVITTRAKTSQRGVENRHQPGQEGDQRDPGLVHSHHDGHGPGRQVDQERHPDEADQEEQHRSQQPDTQTQPLFQELVGAGHPAPHVDRNDGVGHDQEGEGIGQEVEQSPRPFGDGFPGNGQIGNGAQQRGEHGEPDENRVHAAAAGKVLPGRLLPTAVEVAESDGPERVEEDDGPVDSRQSAGQGLLLIRRPEISPGARRGAGP